MNRFLRIASTLVVGIGLILLFVYLSFQDGTSKAQVLNQPSYYTIQNYWYLFLAGIGCTACSLFGSYLSWHKTMDTKREALPNAVGAQKADLLTWLTGSSLDTDTHPAQVIPDTAVEPEEQTLIPSRTPKVTSSEAGQPETEAETACTASGMTAADPLTQSETATLVETETEAATLAETETETATALDPEATVCAEPDTTAEEPPTLADTAEAEGRTIV